MMGLSLQAKGYLYAMGVRSVMLYRSKTWAAKEEDICNLKLTDSSTNVCGVHEEQAREC